MDRRWIGGLYIYVDQHPNEQLQKPDMMKSVLQKPV